jgi:acetyltransferase-like isoleucine patch superfamily enzyme
VIRRTTADEELPGRAKPLVVGEVEVAPGLRADPMVILGYPSGRIEPATLHLGADARLRSGTVLYGGSTIGDRLATGHHVVVREECQIGSDVSIWSNAMVEYGCIIGDRVKVHIGSFLGQYCVLEDDVFLSGGVVLANDLYPGNRVSARLMRGPTIGAGAQLGINCSVLPFVSIGARSIIGSGSVVTRDIPPGVIAAGNPARVLREIPDGDELEGRVQNRAELTTPLPAQVSETKRARPIDEEESE